MKRQLSPHFAADTKGRRSDVPSTNPFVIIAIVIGVVVTAAAFAGG